MIGKYNPFKGALIVSIIIFLFGALIHYTRVKPNNWGAFILWIPLYISPMWALAGASWVSENKSNRGIYNKMDGKNDT